MTGAENTPGQKASSRSATLDLKTVAASLGAFWLTFLMLYTVRSLILGTPHQFAAFIRRTVVAVVGIALAWLMYRLMAWLRPKRLSIGIAQAAAMSLPAALLYAIANFLVFDVIAPMPGDVSFSGANANLRQLISGLSELTINWSFVFAAWGLLYLSLAAAARTREADLRASAHLEAARLAEIRALRYQVNPHFLFNLLNALATLVGRSDTGEAEALIGEMGRFFRFSLATDPVADVFVRDEVDMQMRYLELERRRFPGRLTIEIDVEDAVSGAAVPSLILQPLVENAVKYGLGGSSDPVTVRIRAFQGPDRTMILIVEDDAGTTGHRPAAGTGTGLKNVADRLAARFGPGTTCRAGPQARGYRVELSLPLVRVQP